MTILLVLCGALTGWLLTGLADILPVLSRRLRGETEALPRLPHPAFWTIFRRGPYGPGFRLRLAVEGVSALWFGLLGSVPALRAQAPLLAAGYIFFLLVALIDLKYRLVLNIMVFPAIAVVLLLHITRPDTALLPVLVGGVMAFGIFFLVAWLRPGDLGGGDVKLALLLGLIFGFPGILWALLIGAGAGGLAAGGLLLRGHGTKHTIAYAPFLCLGAMLALIYNPFTVL